MKLSPLFFSLLISASISRCNSTDQDKFCALSRPLITNLDEATSLILALIQGDSLTMMLENPDQDMLELLIKNFSPAEIAFETEILKGHLPTVALFITTDTPDYQTILDNLGACAQEFHGRCNFVEIDIRKLFKVAHLSRIQDIPTILFLHNRSELGRITEGFEQENIKEKIVSFIEEAELIKNKKQE